MRMGVKLRFICNMRSKKLLLLLSVIPLASCNREVVLHSSGFYFDTLVDVKLFEGKQEYVDDIMHILDMYDMVADSYRTRTPANVYDINHTNEVVTVGEELYNLLFAALDVHNYGATYFNPLCGSLSDLWKNSLAEGEIPNEEDIAAELSKMSTTTIEFSDGCYIQRLGDATIDLGGIAKGYALDRCKDYLFNGNIKKYLINGGSSSILLGEKNTKDGYFTVGISDLTNSYLKLKNCFVSTSSKSVQGVTIGDVTYSHIVNPVTGSAINLNDAVIVVSEKGYLGDALSTSMMMNTVEEIQAIETEQNVKTIVIRDGAAIYVNEGLTIYHR